MFPLDSPFLLRNRSNEIIDSSIINLAPFRFDSFFQNSYSIALETVNCICEYLRLCIFNGSHILREKTFSFCERNELMDFCCRCWLGNVRRISIDLDMWPTQQTTKKEKNVPNYIQSQLLFFTRNGVLDGWVSERAWICIENHPILIWCFDFYRFVQFHSIPFLLWLQPLPLGKKDRYGRTHA